MQLNRQLVKTYGEIAKSNSVARDIIIDLNLDFSSFDKEIKTLLITSSTPGEGKSTITANLGSTMAMTGKKVLILDAERLPFRCNHRSRL